MASPPKRPAPEFTYEDLNNEEDQIPVRQNQDGTLAVAPRPRPTITTSRDDDLNLYDYDSDVEYLMTVETPTTSRNQSRNRSQDNIANEVYKKLKIQVDQNSAQTEVRIEQLVKKEMKNLEANLKQKIQTSTNDLSMLLTSQVEEEFECRQRYAAKKIGKMRAFLEKLKPAMQQACKSRDKLTAELIEEQEEQIEAVLAEIKTQKRNITFEVDSNNAKIVEKLSQITNNMKEAFVGIANYLESQLPVKDDFVYKLERMIASLDDLELVPLTSPRSRNMLRPKNTEELNAARDLSDDESMNVSPQSQEQ